MRLKRFSDRHGITGTKCIDRPSNDSWNSSANNLRHKHVLARIVVRSAEMRS